jgi:hypothetical protein
VPIRSIAELHVQHYREVMLCQRVIDGITVQADRVRWCRGRHRALDDG